VHEVKWSLVGVSRIDRNKTELEKFLKRHKGHEEYQGIKDM